MPNKKKKKSLLPKELIHIPNADKKFHEEWDDNDDPLDFPHPVRILLASGGKPNLRKTNTLKNIIVRQQPPFEKIYLLHCGGAVTKEYDEFNAECLSEVPEPYDEELFDPDTKTLLVLEDLNYGGMNRRDKGLLNRLYGYTSTHQNLSIMATSQGFFDIPPSIRRMSNVLIIWKPKDMDHLETLRRRVDMTKKDWNHIFEQYCHEPFDSIWIDDTKNSPHKLRLNGYKSINLF